LVHRLELLRHVCLREKRFARLCIGHSTSAGLDALGPRVLEFCGRTALLEPSTAASTTTEFARVPPRAAFRAPHGIIGYRIIGYRVVARGFASIFSLSPSMCDVRDTRLSAVLMPRTTRRATVAFAAFRVRAAYGAH